MASADFLFDAVPKTYVFKCDWIESGMTHTTATHTVEFHMITDTLTENFWWKGSWMGAMIKEGVLRNCKDVDFDANVAAAQSEQAELFPILHHRLAVVMYNLDILRGRFNGKNLHEVNRVMKNLEDYRHILQRLKLPVALSFSEHPDLDTSMYASVIELLDDSIGAGAGKRYVINANFVYATQDSSMAVPLPTPDNNMSPERWKNLFLGYHALGSHTHARGLYWNSYWWKLAGEELETSACKNPGDDDDVGNQNNEILPRLSHRRKSFLLLGGDARPERICLIYHLWKNGALDNALWSLQTPPVCCEHLPEGTCENHEDYSHPELEEFALRKGRDEMELFCQNFPKNLDRKLDGGVLDSTKDVSFPPVELYNQTRFSVTFESHVPNTFFATEKPLKPLYRGHPFVLVGGSLKELEVLKSFGFETFSEIIDETYDANPCMQGMCKDLEDAIKKNAGVSDDVSEFKIHFESYQRVAEFILNITKLPAERWDEVSGAVARNQRHIACGGFRKVHVEHARAILQTILAE
eukprot:CAMPEP_0197520598 /NCGR_PEP_ID=MMETSP1318-20131121/5950_1 /TAXON_ID=552666 /ORGANISM="Partenskyella glossopodia, Strain RCC365" /LENGTH=524 /DNA_ID=CAMNT_0043072259 /DNA_START=240 /DNA_END=1814 /DNA_ORIENTATION=-